MTRHSRWPGLLATALLLLTSCRPSGSDQTDPDLLATVGTASIRRPELEAAARRRGIADPIGMSNVLEELIDRQILLQNAHRDRFDERPEVVDLLKEQLVTLYLQQGTVSTNPIPVSETQARDYRDRNPEKFQRDPRLRLAAFHLQVPVSAGETARGLARSRLGEIGNEVKHRIPPADGFGQLSQRSEDAATRRNGGDLGWLDRSEIVRRWPGLTNLAGLSAADVGHLIGPLEGGDDWLLLRVTGFEPGGPRPWEEVRQLAEYHARQEMIIEAARNRRASLRQGVSISRPNGR